MPYVYIHNPMGYLLFFGRILSQVLSGLEKSMEFGKRVSAPPRESLLRLRIRFGRPYFRSAMILPEVPSCILRAKKEQASPYRCLWLLPLLLRIPFLLWQSRAHGPEPMCAHCRSAPLL